MCLIIASPKGKRIPDHILNDAARTNSHGAGIAWYDSTSKTEEKIQFRKGLTTEEVIELMDKEVKDAAHVVHFRIATVGGSIPELTHPFSVDENASVALEGRVGAVLFHNGTFGGWKEHLLQAAAASGIPLPEAPWSDSRAVAFMCHVYGKHLLSILDGGSRYLVFDGNEPDARKILLWGDWHSHDELKYSNRQSSVFDYRQGGATNFQQGRFNSAPGGNAGRSSAESSAESKTGSESPTGGHTGSEDSPTGSLSHTRTAPTATNKRRIVKPREGHSPWRIFSKTGDKQVVGENETAPATV